MNQYVIYQRGDSIQAVKQGWSWVAMFGLGIWSLIKGLWAISLGLAGMTLTIYANAIILGIVEEDPDSLIVGIMLLLIYGIICGALGNSWLERDLLGRGYQRQGMRIARNPAGAIMAYLYPADRQQPYHQVPEDVYPVQQAEVVSRQPEALPRQDPRALPPRRE